MAITIPSLPVYCWSFSPCNLTWPPTFSNGSSLKARHAATIHVTKMVFEMLHFFISNIDKAITRDDFLNYVWKNEHVVQRTIDVHIKKLRDIVGKDKIETLTGIGYIWKSN
jgi:DNA-binding response OmpR family regulator